MAPRIVEDQVVTLSAPGEVLSRVIDDMIGAYRSDQLHVCGAANGGHVGSERLRDLDREGAHASSRTVDQDLLPSLQLSDVAKRLQCGHSRDGDSCGLIE